jgi:hypothetical protein
MLKSLRVSQLVAINLGIVLCLSLLIGLAGLTAYYISKNQNEVILQRNQVDRLTLQLQMLTIERSDIFHRYLETGDTRLALLDQSKHSAYLSVYNELAILSKSSSEAVALDQLDAAEKDFNALVQQAFSLSQNNQAGAARDLRRVTSAREGTRRAPGRARSGGPDRRRARTAVGRARRVPASR